MDYQTYLIKSAVNKARRDFRKEAIWGGDRIVPSVLGLGKATKDVGSMIGSLFQKIPSQAGVKAPPSVQTPLKPAQILEQMKQEQLARLAAKKVRIPPPVA